VLHAKSTEGSDRKPPENRRWVSRFNRQGPKALTSNLFTLGQKQERAPKRPFSVINKSYRSISAFTMKMPSNKRDGHQCQQQLSPLLSDGIEAGTEYEIRKLPADAPIKGKSPPLAAQFAVIS